MATPYPVSKSTPIHARPVIIPLSTSQLIHGRNTGSPRAKLTEIDAVNIFGMKSSISAIILSNAYGVSEKAVRDIWIGRTWRKETWHLDPSRALQIKRLGRPKGSKDSQPRKKRSPLSLTKMHTQSDYALTGIAPEIDNCVELEPDEKIDNHRPLDSASSNANTLDQQLFEWDERIWYDQRHPDPF